MGSKKHFQRFLGCICKAFCCSFPKWKNYFHWEMTFVSLHVNSRLVPPSKLCYFSSLCPPPPPFFFLLPTSWLLDLSVFWLYWQGSHYGFYDIEEERQSIAWQWFIYIGSKLVVFCRIKSSMCTFFRRVNSSRYGRPKVLDSLDLPMFSRHNRLKYNGKNVI